jgi:hypothetical protein
MKTRVLLALLLLMTFIAIYASEDPTENEVYLQKTRELKALSERFKAETGFVGRIDYSYDEMCLQSFDGVFSDIKVVTADDTLALRPAFDTILTKLLPFSMAPRDQLVKSPIERVGSAYATDFVQIANGYKVAGAGFISIRYFPDTKKFFIGNSAVDIPQEPIGNIISEEEAQRIAKDAHRNRTGRYEFDYKASITSPWYSNWGRNEYNLTYWVTIEEITYFINALTGEVLGLYNFSIDDRILAIPRK